MRRYLLPMFVAALACTTIGCPPTPPPDTDKKDEKKNVIVPPPPFKTPEQLKTRIEAALEQVQSRDLLTTHAFWTIFHGILGSGLEKTTLTDPHTKEKFNAIDYIAKGNEVRGLQFLPTPHGLDVMTAKPFDQEQGVAQGHQDQFIAEMAQWGMPIDRKFIVGGKEFTFESFTRHSKMRASPKQNQELSWAVIIVAQYYGTKHRWTNSFKENLEFDDLVRYEVEQPIEQAACGGTHRLFGLTWAYHLHMQKGGKKAGVWNDVEARIERYKKLARERRNPDGSFSTDYFKSDANANDPHVRIGTTGHIVEWLALAMTDDELKSPWMQDSVNALVKMILDMEKREVDGGSLYHATHGLHLYHMRVFGRPPPFLPLPPKK